MPTKSTRKPSFKNAEGFEVYSVSLDSDVARWEAAIKKDKLEWKWHVSDLKRWNSEAAAVYGVNSIPMSFLIDENGVILAKNLRGFELHRQDRSARRVVLIGRVASSACYEGGLTGCPLGFALALVLSSLMSNHALNHMETNQSAAEEAAANTPEFRGS
jgi:hypothetical protein